MKFKAEDFAEKDPIWSKHVDAARIANELLQAHLDTLPRVYAQKDGLKNSVWRANEWSADTHTALLWDITKIEKECKEHEPVNEPCPLTLGFKCKHCGVKLKAKWEKA